MKLFRNFTILDIEKFGWSFNKVEYEVLKNSSLLDKIVRFNISLIIKSMYSRHLEYS
jgi:hypothetical protein